MVIVAVVVTVPPATVVIGLLPNTRVVPTGVPELVKVTAEAKLPTNCTDTVEVPCVP